MSGIENTDILDSFRKEVLIQNEFFAYHKLVQWMHKKKIEKFDFQTKSTKYVFEALEDGINIYTSSVYLPHDVSKRFASFSYYLPKKDIYLAPQEIS